MKRILIFAIILILNISNLKAEGYSMNDLNSINLYDIVKVETCLRKSYKEIEGKAIKLEFKLEKDIPVYEFKILSSKDKFIFNVECNAKSGEIIEIEREVNKNNKEFLEASKISVSQARMIALKAYPGKVISEEREIGINSSYTYQFDIKTDKGYEIKIDVNAITGNIVEANIEIYEIGVE